MILNTRIISKCEQSNLVDSLPDFHHDFVIIHSSFLGIGIPDGGVVYFLDRLIERIGNKKTILMPTFNFANNKIWKCETSRSECGVLTELFRTRKDVSRSIHPIHSLASYGPRSQEITEHFDLSSFGKSSIWKHLIENENTVNISIGTGWVGGGTFHHYSEEKMLVPYREFITLDREVYDCKDSLINCQFKYFANKDKNLYGNEWSCLLNDLLTEGILKRWKINNVQFFLQDTKEVSSYIQFKLEKNPYYLTKYMKK